MTWLRKLITRLWRRLRRGETRIAPAHAARGRLYGGGRGPKRATGGAKVRVGRRIIRADGRVEALPDAEGRIVR